jgi:hypothetical protein
MYYSSDMSIGLMLDFYELYLKNPSGLNLYFYFYQKCAVFGSVWESSAPQM